MRLLTGSVRRGSVSERPVCSGVDARVECGHGCRCSYRAAFLVTDLWDAPTLVLVLVIMSVAGWR